MNDESKRPRVSVSGKVKYREIRKRRDSRLKLDMIWKALQMADCFRSLAVCRGIACCKCSIAFHVLDDSRCPRMMPDSSAFIGLTGSNEAQHLTQES